MGNHSSNNNSHQKRIRHNHDEEDEMSISFEINDEKGSSKKEHLVIGLALIVYAVALYFKATDRSKGIVMLLSFLIPFFICGYEVLVDTVRKVLHGEFLDESFLMTVSSICAFFINKYPEAVAIMLFFRIGEMLEEYAEEKSRNKISDLTELRPDKAHVETIDGIAVVNPSDVKIGSRIIVLPGERVPLDGIVINGDSSLNLASLSGESMPVAVRKGDTVYSGSINISSPIKVRVTNDYSDSTASRILKLIEQAVERKSKQENLIRRFSKLYTPIVVAMAVILAVVPSLISKQWDIWINKALVFLVVSCPCALVISVPLAYFAGIGNAAQNGILIKGSNYLEALARAKTYVFDKTGTVTEGKFSVEKVYTQGISPEVLLNFAAAAESYSSHPLAKAVKESAEKSVISGSTVTEYVEYPGMGIKANVNGAVVCVGNADYIRQECGNFSTQAAEGTAAYVSINSRYRGCIVFSDKIKPGVFDALEELRATGVNKLVMLTGDVNSISRKVAQSLNFDMMKSELLPQDKVAAVEYLINNNNNNETLAFIGDGVNDAPVLARADVGLAMGCFGSEAAIEAADIVIMDDDIRQVTKAARISSYTVEVAKQNIIISIGAKVAIMLMGLIGIGGIWLAVIGDVGVLFVAILNSLRALGKKY